MAEATILEGWRESPPPSAYEMVDADLHPSIFVAGDRNHDRMTMAAALDCLYTEVRMTTFYAVWDPEAAERAWREWNCSCFVPGHTGDELEYCETTNPAERLDDFWTEDGHYCPWRRVPKGTPGAVAFREGRVA